jgi:hypothetical protein
MQRLKQVVAIDIETCPHCGGTLREWSHRGSLAAPAAALPAKIPDD